MNIHAGAMSPNEARQTFGLEPYEGGDSFVQALVGSVVAGGGLYGGTGSIVGNTAGGIASFVGAGWGNNASALGSSIVGGTNAQASGSYSIILSGQLGNTRSINGNTVVSSANALAGNSGNIQGAILILGRQTTDATATVLCSDASAASSTNQVILPNNSAYTYKATGISTAQFVLATTAASSSAGTSTITFSTQTAAPFNVGQTIVVAGVTPLGFNGTKTVTACTTTSVSFSGSTTGPQTVAGTITGTSFTKSWKIEGAIMRSSSAAGTRLVGSATTTVLAQDTDASTWTLVPTADTTNGGLTFTFTGEAGRTIRTVVKVDTTEVTF
jgi:hypothetical protein